MVKKSWNLYKIKAKFLLHMRINSVKSKTDKVKRKGFTDSYHSEKIYFGNMKLFPAEFIVWEIDCMQNRLSCSRNGMVELKLRNKIFN